MEVPRLGVQSELLPPASTTATATPGPSRVCDLHHSSWQRWILNPLSEARDRTCNLMVPLSHDGNSMTFIFIIMSPRDILSGGRVDDEKICFIFTFQVKEKKYLGNLFKST